MKKSLLSGIFILLFVQGFGQKITGTVYDKYTRIPLHGASVFFNGSSLGTVTDRLGDFKLQLPENQRLPIVATFPGYESLLLLEYPKNAHIHFFIDQRIYALSNESSPKKLSEKDTRRVNLELFREQFLGSSANGISCKILNERDLILKYNPRTEILTAHSGKPLMIVNKALGYRIIYYLEKFEFSAISQIINCTGCSRFIGESSLNKIEQESAERKRELAYFGSEMEFFRALWHNALDSAGYDLRSILNKKLTYDSLVLESNGSKYWRYKDPVIIYHFSRNKSTTFQTADTVYFDKLGYCDTQGIKWRKSGEMTFQRLADQLPFDYKVTQKRSNIREE